MSYSTCSKARSVQLAGSSLSDSGSSLSEMYQPQDEVIVCKTLVTQFVLLLARQGCSARLGPVYSVQFSLNRDLHAVVII